MANSRNFSQLLFRWLVLIFGVSLLAYVLGRAGSGAVWKEVRAVGWGLALIIILGGFSQLIKTCAWRQAFACDISALSWSQQIYASHYFETALDLTVCVRDTQRPGFYIITVKGSKQAGLTGLKGSIVRKVAVDKARSSLARVLATIKQRLESHPAQID